MENTQDDDLQYIVRMLVDCNFAVVAQKTGLSYLTVYNIAKGKNVTPSFATVKKLAEYFRGKK